MNTDDGCEVKSGLKIFKRLQLCLKMPKFVELETNRIINL